MFKRPKTAKNINSAFNKLVEYVKDNTTDLELTAKGLDGILSKFYVEWPDKTAPTLAGIESTWELIMDEINYDDGNRIDLAKLFNEMLDDMLSNDFFGTEGQCDPRGDHRD